MTACPKCSHDPAAQVLASWTFTIPRDLPSLNERIHNGAKGWKYRKTRDEWRSDLGIMRRSVRMPWIDCAADYTGKRRVTLTRLYTGRMREMDLANIDAKACVDAMKLAGLIYDDAPRYYEGHVLQERGIERGTRVLIEELA